MMYAHKTTVTHKYMQSLCNDNIKSDKQKNCHCGICAPLTACKIHCSYIHNRKLSASKRKLKLADLKLFVDNPRNHIYMWYVVLKKKLLVFFLPFLHQFILYQFILSI